jgi:hypothetical protein
MTATASHQLYSIREKSHSVKAAAVLPLARTTLSSFAHCLIALLLAVRPLDAADSPLLKARVTEDAVEIETDMLSIKIAKRGYVSGTMAGTLVDKETGARDLGFGLHIMDFLLAPGYRDDGYGKGLYHGNIAKHYVEGPQICTQAKKLDPEVITGDGFIAVRMKYKFHQAYRGYMAGSTWEQTLVFKPGRRWFLCDERITSVNDVDSLFYRVDMPGHLKHKNGDSFEKVYLSYHGVIPASAFAKDFAPDEKLLYQRKDEKLPARFIRAYQVKQDGKPGPWLAGMTLDPAQVYEAWCHQRGYICFIQELHGRKVKAGESFGAAYIVGWFGSIDEMHTVYDKHKGMKEIPPLGK